MKTKSVILLLVVVDAGLCWLFYGFSDFFGGNGHPSLSVFCFYFFVVTLLGVMAIAVYKQWQCLKVILPTWIFLCFLFGVIIYKSSHQLPEQTLKTLGVVEREPKVALETLGVTPKWQPPELPKDCSSVNVRLGGTTFGCPPALLQSNAISVDNFMHILGFPRGESPIVPHIKNNCLYIAVKSLLRTNLDTVFMNEDLDYPLPPKWDRNYNSNALEIVAEDGLPALQVIYLRPDFIQVNGIFFISENTGLIAFDGGFSVRNFPVEANDLIFSQRKVIFKYPSTNHLGELAE